MSIESTLKPRPGHKAVRVNGDGAPWIEGFRCGKCSAVVADKTMACRSCGGRNALAPFSARHTGKVFSWTVVHRSYPGIAVPFVSVIVDLDEGPTLKGTLRDIDPAKMRPGMPLRLVFDDAGGACDSQGAPFVGFHFVAEEAAA